MADEKLPQSAGRGMGANSDEDLDDTGSLEAFEQEFLSKDKAKKSSQPIVIFIAMVVVLVFGGYQAYTGKMLDRFLPPSYQYAVRSIKIPDAPVTPVAPSQEVNGFVDEVEFEEEPVAKVEPEPVKVKKEKPKAVAPVAKPEPKPAPVPAKPKPTVRQDQDMMMSSMGRNLQVGVYAKRSNAEAMAQKLIDLGYEPTLEKTVSYEWKLRVLLGFYPYREKAMDAAKDLLNRGYSPKVEIVAAGTYSLEMGYFNSEKDAKQLMDKMKDKGLEPRTDRKKASVPATRVIIKGLGTSGLEEAATRLNAAGIPHVVVKY